MHETNWVTLKESYSHTCEEWIVLLLDSIRLATLRHTDGLCRTSQPALSDAPDDGPATLPCHTALSHCLALLRDPKIS